METTMDPYFHIEQGHHMGEIVIRHQQIKTNQTRNKKDTKTIRLEARTTENFIKMDDGGEMSSITGGGD